MYTAPSRAPLFLELDKQESRVTKFNPIDSETVNYFSATASVQRLGSKRSNLSSCSISPGWRCTQRSRFWSPTVSKMFSLGSLPPRELTRPEAKSHRDKNLYNLVTSVRHLPITCKRLDNTEFLPNANERVHPDDSSLWRGNTSRLDHSRTNRSTLCTQSRRDVN